MSDGEPPIDSPEIRRLTPVLEPGYTYASVTDKISAIVLTRPTSFSSATVKVFSLKNQASAWLEAALLQHACRRI